MRLFRSTLFWAVLGLALVGATVWQYHPLSLAALGDAPTPPAGQSGSGGTSSSLEQRVIAEGRVVTYHGAQITFSAEIPGLIQKLTLDENDAVAKDDVIAEIKVDDLRSALAEAKARLSEILAQTQLATLELKRDTKLRAASAVSQDELDKAQKDYDLLVAQRATAEATIQKIEATVAKAVIHSPIAGVVITRFAQPGEMAEVGTKLLTIADTNRLRLEAEIDEFDASQIYLGQPAKITAEGYPGKSWRGKVEQIPEVVTEKNLKPTDPSRPTDARVLRVKIAFQEPTPLKLGQRVEVELPKR